MEIMTRGRFRHLPVEKNGQLDGIISIGDVVKRRIEDVEREAEEIRAVYRDGLGPPLIGIAAGFNRPSSFGCLGIVGRLAAGRLHPALSFAIAQNPNLGGRTSRHRPCQKTQAP